MVWHVHCNKKGKFAIWSTIIDAYMTPWSSEGEIRAKYVYHAIFDAIDSANTNIERAQKEGCSALNPFKCGFKHLVVGGERS